MVERKGYSPQVARSRWIDARPSPRNSKNWFRTFKPLSFSELAIGASAFCTRSSVSTSTIPSAGSVSCLPLLRRMNGVDFVLVLLLKEVRIIHGRVAAMGALQALDVNAVF